MTDQMEIQASTPLARAEQVYEDLDTACLKALNGIETSASNFVLTPKFREIRAWLIGEVGRVYADHLLSQWFYERRTLFTKPRNI